MRIKPIHIIVLLTLLSLTSCLSADVEPGASTTVGYAAPTYTPSPIPTPISKVESGEAVLSQTVNDIKVDVTFAKTTGTGIAIGICYTTPDNGEWYPMPGHLFYGEYESYPNTIGFSPDEKIADGENMGKRCATILYVIDGQTTLTAPVKFSVLSFYAPGREMYSPCEEFQQRLDTNPKAQSYGLKAKCEETSDGNVSVTLVDNDKSVAKDKASKALEEIAKGEVAGPWAFTINELER